MDKESTERYLGLLIDGGCKVKYRTNLFGKEYVWLQDPRGTWFLEALPHDN